MKTSELRIGFWYNYEGQPIQMDEDALSNILRIGGEYNYEPIPLTKEWLVKFGFKDGKRGWFKTGARNSKFNLYMYGRCDYVHQLQNLYFAITREELTIKE